MKFGFLVLLLVCGRAIAQPDDPSSPQPDPAPAPQPDPPPAPPPAEPNKPAPKCTGSLDVHAVDATTHEPVIAATVRSGDKLFGTTDDQGQITLTGLCAGNLVLVIERDDYNAAEKTVKIAGATSIEIEMRHGELIEIRDKAPPPPDMRSTATVSGADLEKSRGKSFTAAIAGVAGVSELKAATGVAKPIIRGQFGRRLLILVDGVRHRSQEWGLEHAPEIDPFVAEAIRVVRGPGGVRYGSDAIGGVVLVDPPDLRSDAGYNGEVHMIGATNGRGGTVAGRVQSVFERIPRLSLQLEGSAQRLAAPVTPDYALDNAGAFAWTGGVTVGYSRKKAEYKASYRHYDAKLGVCACLRIENVDDFRAQAAAGEPIGADQFTSEFGIDRPKQAVGHDLALARARFELPRGKLTVGYSFQHDRRREFDVVRNAGEVGAQFNFRLYTHEVEGVFEHDPVHLDEHWHLRGAAGVIATGQIHYYSGLQLIPDFKGFGSGVYATERLIGHDTDLEIGARYDFLTRSAALERIDFQRLVRSDQIAMDACSDPNADQVKCGSTYHTATATAGASQRIAENLLLKGDLSLASRAPNPDEQYLNGAAPTFPVLGLGKPDIKRETTYASSLTLAYSHDKLKGEASAFANYINNYIYFSPAIDDAGMPIFDITIRGAFPRFITENVDAVFYGADGGLTATPIPQLELAAQAALVRAKNVEDDRFLVFVPADRYRGSVTYRAPDVAGLRKTFATVSGMYVAKQRRFDINADFIAPPPAYFLLGAEVGTETRIGDQTARIAIQGSNLTNARYRDYTSLMRYFADEPGWQVWLRMSLFFDSKKGK